MFFIDMDALLQDVFILWLSNDTRRIFGRLKSSLY